MECLLVGICGVCVCVCVVTLKGEESLFVKHNSDTRRLKLLYRGFKITLKYIKNKKEEERKLK